MINVAVDTAREQELAENMLLASSAIEALSHSPVGRSGFLASSVC